MNRVVRAIIFDLDGTLIDSRPAVLKATISALAEHNVAVTEAEILDRFGGGTRTYLSYFLERGRGPEYANLHVDKVCNRENELQMLHTESVELLPWSKGLLAKLRGNGYRLALATMSARNVVEKILHYHGINDYFDVVMTADDVVRGKPDPEMLENVIEHLDEEISGTLYVGDSDHDLDAAASLGMSFILGDTGVYVQGERRVKLLGKAREHGYPVLSTDELAGIGDLAET